VGSCSVETVQDDFGGCVTLAFGAVGFVESATTRWLNDPAPAPLPEFTAQLAE
jgi:hypothetical protein